jgi:RNA polymerase sigma factor (sigma-70 family)
MDSYTEQDILDNMGLVRKIAGFMQPRHTNSLMDVDDLVSEGIIGLFKAFERWDPERSRFATFASHKIKYEMIEAHRNAFKQYRQSKRSGLPTPTYLYLDDKDGDEEMLPGEFLSEDELIDKIDATLVLEKTWDLLPPREQHIIELIRKGMNQQEVATEIGVSPTRIHTQYHKALGRIRDYHSNHRRLQ